MSENKSVFIWTFCQLLKWKIQLHKRMNHLIEKASICSHVHPSFLAQYWPNDAITSRSLKSSQFLVKTTHKWFANFLTDHRWFHWDAEKRRAGQVQGFGGLYFVPRRQHKRRWRHRTAGPKKTSLVRLIWFLKCLTSLKTARYNGDVHKMNSLGMSHPPAHDGHYCA